MNILTFRNHFLISIQYVSIKLTTDTYNVNGTARPFDVSFEIQQQVFADSGDGSSKLLRGMGRKKFGLRGLIPQKRISFGPFVYWIWTLKLLKILDFSLLFLIFLYFSSSSEFFFFDVPLTENFKGECPPPIHPTSTVCVCWKFPSHLFTVITLHQGKGQRLWNLFYGDLFHQTIATNSEKK